MGSNPTGGFTQPGVASAPRQHTLAAAAAVSRPHWQALAFAVRAVRGADAAREAPGAWNAPRAKGPATLQPFVQATSRCQTASGSPASPHDRPATAIGCESRIWIAPKIRCARSPRPRACVFATPRAQTPWHRRSDTQTRRHPHTQEINRQASGRQPRTETITKAWPEPGKKEGSKPEACKQTQNGKTQTRTPTRQRMPNTGSTAALA